MGVESTYVAMIGLKKDIDYIRVYNSINDDEYVCRKEDGELNNVKHIIFKDNLPDNYDSFVDYMGGEYSCIGKILDITPEYIDEIGSISFSPEDLSKQKQEVIKELKALKLDFNEDEIKFYSFICFS